MLKAIYLCLTRGNGEMLVLLVPTAFVSPDVQHDVLRDENADAHFVFHRRPFLDLRHTYRDVHFHAR